jgi:hypothetical protein
MELWIGAVVEDEVELDFGTCDLLWESHAAAA